MRLRRAGNMAVALLLAAVVAGAIACRVAEAPEREPDISGIITAVAPGPADGPLGTIRVETVPEDEAGTPKASITINPETQIHRDASRDGQSFSALSEGVRVHVWFTGPVRESYPVQAAAERVLIDAGAP